LAGESKIIFDVFPCCQKYNYFLRYFFVPKLLLPIFAGRPYVAAKIILAAKINMDLFSAARAACRRRRLGLAWYGMGGSGGVRQQRLVEAAMEQDLERTCVRVGERVVECHVCERESGDGRGTKGFSAAKKDR
jgi:hypothetical protein